MKKIFLFLTVLLSLYGSSVNLPFWQPTEYVWNLGLMLECDRHMKEIPFSEFSKEVYGGIQPYEIVWIRNRWVDEFVNQVLPELKHPIILVSGEGDESIPRFFFKNQKSFEILLNHPKIAHWFSQNADVFTPHPKFTPIPIGIDFHTITEHCILSEVAICTPKMQEDILNKILSELKPTHERIVGSLLDFHFNDSSSYSINHFASRFGETRKTIADRLKDLPFIQCLEKPLPRLDLWKKKGTYAFSISPMGCGLDCHRTWEDLALGCIVIVKSTPLDPLYEGLPVVIVNDWSEVTEENLYRWLDKYGDAFENPTYRERLTHYYWVHQIQKKQFNLRN